MGLVVTTECSLRAGIMVVPSVTTALEPVHGTKKAEGKEGRTKEGKRNKKFK